MLAIFGNRVRNTTIYLILIIYKILITNVKQIPTLKKYVSIFDSLCLPEPAPCISAALIPNSPAPGFCCWMKRGPPSICQLYPAVPQFLLHGAQKPQKGISLVRLSALPSGSHPV